MEFERVLKFLEGKAILVTGATGFLAKTFVEKVLRIQPNVKKLYLLIRASDDDSAFLRMHSEVIEKELFGVLREKQDKYCFDSFISEKLTSVCGDVSLEELGVKDNKLKEQIWNEVEIVINSAATTKFDERYDVALGINTMGVFNVLSFAKKCIKLKVLLHLSTAYVCGERQGLVKEDIFYRGNESKTKTQSTLLDFELENKLVEEKLKELEAQKASDIEITTTMRDFGMKRAKMYGWPNTYVFTKAMGEICLLNSEEALPKVIVRPTIITSTYREPFPGWIEGIRTLDSVIAGYGLGKATCFLGNPKTIMDIIPVDMVVNIMIVAIMEANANYQTSSSSTNLMKYQIGSSLVNPITLSAIRDLSFEYFTKNPLSTRTGKLIKVSRLTLLKSTLTFNMYMAIRFMLPLKIMQLGNIVFCHYSDTYTRNNKKIQLVMRMVKLYKPYVLFKGIFDFTNTEQLWMAIREDSKAMQVLNFDAKSIDWEDYLMNTHIPGLPKYVIK